MTVALEIKDDSAQIIRRGRIIDSARFTDFQKLFFVTEDLWLADFPEMYNVAVLPDRLWVLPCETEAEGVLTGKLIDLLREKQALFDTAICACPFAWRHWILGILPLFPYVQLGVFRLKTLPKWEEITTHELDG